MKVAFLVLLFAFCFADDEIYMGGNFLLTIQNEDGNLDHVASLVTYDPNADKYIDTFDGGVFMRNGYIQLMQETPLGFYCAGVFRFMDDDYDYCNSVLRYNNDDDDWESLHDGIFLRNSESIDFIAGTNDYTYFAGSFSSVEYLSEQSEEMVFVPNIVQLDSDDNWALLDNSNSVFPGVPNIMGLTAFNDTLYIYASSSTTTGTLYSYVSGTGFTLITTYSLLGDIVVDKYGNIGAIALDDSAPTGDGTYTLVIFAAGTYSVTTQTLYTTLNGQCTTGSSVPKVIAWDKGFLIAMAKVTSGCSGYTWAYYNSDAGTIDLTYTAIPSVSQINSLVVGDDNDLWLATSDLTEIQYLPTDGQQWIEVNLNSFTSFSIDAMAWDNGPNKLLVYALADGVGTLIEVIPIANPPIIAIKNPGILTTPGFVKSLAVMNDPDDDDYELFIGGFFDGIGHGHALSNLVRFKQGNYDAPLENIPPISVLATYGSTLFYATTTCAENSFPLPIGYYSENTKDLDVWLTIPTVTGGTGCVSAIYADENFVFFGGAFSVLIPGSSSVAYGVVYFDRRVNLWANIQIPSTLSSTSGAHYDINSISMAQQEDGLYVAIGGRFEMTLGTNTYNSFAIFNLNTREWLPVPAEFSTDTIINSVIMDGMSSVYIAGSLQLASGGKDEGVFDYLMDSNTYTTIGNLPTTAESMILHTVTEDDVDHTFVYAGGYFVNGTNYLGLAYAENTTSPGTSWTRAAESSQFLQYFTGDVNTLIYATGGLGEGGQNGYDSDYTPQFTSAESGGMSGWGIFFLTVFIFLVVAVLIAVVAGGFVAYKKRLIPGITDNYQEL